MRVYACDFLFNGVSAHSQGFGLCTWDEGGNADVTNAGSTIELTTAKPVRSDKWYSYGQEYSKPLTFKIHLIKIDYSDISAREKAMIARWLLRNDGYKKFQFGSDGYFDIVYNATGIDMKEINVIGTVGLEVEFVCESPFGHSPTQTKQYKVNGQNQVYNFANGSDEIGYLYPRMIITVDADCDISIVNQFDANRETKITKCKAGEIIRLNNELKIIKSSIPLLHEIQDCFNYQWLRFYRNDFDGNNTLIMSGNFTIKMEYEYVRKIGVGE